MNKLEKQIKDWTEIKTLFKVVNIRFGKYRTETLQEAYGKIKNYYHTYHKKFDPGNIPREE